MLKRVFIYFDIHKIQLPRLSDCKSMMMYMISFHNASKVKRKSFTKKKILVIS